MNKATQAPYLRFTRCVLRPCLYVPETYPHGVPYLEAPGKAHTPAYRGAMRIAPSSRMVSPFNMGFSMMWQASAANSAGRPERDGNGILASSALRAESGRPMSMGVAKIPGAMVQQRMPYCDRSRAMGSVMPTTPPLEAE